MGKGSRRRPVWIGAIVVVLFLSGVTLAVSALGGGPDIPHPAGGERAACTGCHTIDGLPSSHRDRSDDGCGSCHAESGEAGAAADPDGGAAARSADGGRSRHPDQPRHGAG